MSACSRARSRSRSHEKIVPMPKYSYADAYGFTSTRSHVRPPYAKGLLVKREWKIDWDIFGELTTIRKNDDVVRKSSEAIAYFQKYFPLS